MLIEEHDSAESVVKDYSPEDTAYLGAEDLMVSDSILVIQGTVVKPKITFEEA